MFIYRGSKHGKSWLVQKVVLVAGWLCVTVWLFPSAVPLASLTLTAISISLIMQTHHLALQRGPCADLLSAARWRIHTSLQLRGQCWAAVGGGVRRMQSCSRLCGSGVLRGRAGVTHLQPLYSACSGCVDVSRLTFFFLICRNFKSQSKTPVSRHHGGRRSETQKHFCQVKVLLQGSAAAERRV